MNSQSKDITYNRTSNYQDDVDISVPLIGGILTREEVDLLLENYDIPEPVHLRTRLIFFYFIVFFLVSLE